MPVPKRKTSRSRRDSRSANKGIEVKAVAQCQNCQSFLAPHEVCQQCGHYKGKKVLRTKVERLMSRAERKQTLAPANPASAPVEAQDQQG